MRSGNPSTAGDLSPHPPSLNLKFDCKARDLEARVKVKNSRRQPERRILAVCLGQSNIVMTIISGPASDCHLGHIWAVPQHDAAAAKLTTASAVLLMIPEREQTSGHVGSKGEKEEGEKRRRPPKDGFIWEDPEFETQIQSTKSSNQSAMNSRKISFIMQSGPYSEPALPLSHFGAAAAVGPSDIFQ